MKMIKLLPLIIFDMDGTIIQSKIDYYGTRKQIWNMLKEIMPIEDYEKIVDTPRSILELVSILSKVDRSNTKVKQAWETIEENERKGYEEACVNEDVYETLDYLKNNNYTMTIFTNNSRKLTDFGLSKYNLLKYFDFILTRDDVTNTKPHPEGLIKIIKKFEVNNNSVIFIGDSWIDAETAVNAGIKFIYYGSEGAPGTRRKVIQPDYTIERMSELIEIIESFV